jgi:hypothetical protein
VVKVLVGGGNNVQHYVHAELLKGRSPFFASALRGYADAAHHGHAQLGEESYTWLEGREGVVPLPNDDPEMFTAHIEILYKGVLPIEDNYETSECKANATEQEKKAYEDDSRALALAASTRMFSLLVKVYVFCEKIGDGAVKHVTMTAFIEATYTICAGNRLHMVPNSLTEDIYSGTMEGDWLRTFVVADYSDSSNPTVLSKKDNCLPAEFLLDLTIMLLGRQKSSMLWSLKIQDVKDVRATLKQAHLGEEVNETSAATYQANNTEASYSSRSVNE